MGRNSDCFQDLAGREKAVERLDGLGDGVFYAPQAGNDADTRPIIVKLPKRYECGEFHPHIHFTVSKGPFDFVTCCGVFMNAQQLQEIHSWSLLRPGADDGQLPMLIKAVHVMEDEQGMVRTVPLGDSVVWLQRLDDCAGLITDSLYFSVEQGRFVGSRRPRVEDWKLGSERESDETATFTQLSSPAEPRGTRRWSPPSAWPSTADTAGSYSPGRG